MKYCPQMRCLCQHSILGKDRKPEACVYGDKTILFEDLQNCPKEQED